MQLESDGTACDPYANTSGAARKTGNTTRTDLRKLSEWIKMMRELEERKRNGGGGESGPAKNSACEHARAHAHWRSSPSDLRL